MILFTPLLLLPTASPTMEQQAVRPEAVRPAALDVAELSEYRAFRRMHAVNERFDQEAWLDAWTELDASGFRYQIVREEGSNAVLDKVLRKLLERERELIADGGAHRAALTEANYDFGEPAVSSGGEREIPIKPRRKDVLLVDGRLILNEDGTELLRVEGRLAKNPSFWTSLVNVTREFATLDGVRVPVSTESVAKLKLAGTSRMVVRYEYETINGKPVNRATARGIPAAFPTGR